MRAIATTSASQQAVRSTSIVRQTRARVVKPIVSQQGASNASPAAVALAVAVAATLPLLPVSGASAYVPQWQPIAVVAQEEAVETAVATVVEAPAVEAPVAEAPAVEGAVAEAPAVEAVVAEAPAVEVPAVEVPVVEATPEEAAATLEEEVKDGITAVLEEEIPAVEAEVAGLKDVQQQEVAEDYVDLLEEEASVADEALEKGSPAAPAVAQLLNTIESQLASLKASFGLQ